MNKNQMFPCVECGRVYKHKSSWYQHKRYECGKDAQFACEFCPYRAKQRRTLTAHKAFKHGRTS
ncbi:hypothetical protein J6590_014757 [Homalodisca vitripennis]|nr:hypothetical protein J6590_014757 [Homalodisca vitripennis]